MARGPGGGANPNLSDTTTSDQQTEATPATVGEATPGRVAARGGPRALGPSTRYVVLEVHHDPHEVAAALDVLLDTVVREGSRTGAALADLAEQLADPDRIEEQLRAAATERHAVTIDAAWNQVLAERGRTQAWSVNRFADEWEKYPDPATGWHYERPWSWHRSASQLHEDGCPWHVVRDQIQDTLTGPGARTHAAVLRGGRRTMRRMRARAERLAELDGDGHS